MKIKELKKILKQGNDEAEVYIPGYDGSSRDLDIGYNYDDVGDLDLYIIKK